MNQLLAGEIAAVMPLAVLTGMFSSLCTIGSPDGLHGPSGSPSNTFTNVAGLINIPCVDSVPSQLRIQAAEAKTLAEILSKGYRHVLLNGYYPQIQTNWIATVDGIVFDILGVESDSQDQMTRLELQLATV